MVWDFKTCMPATFWRGMCSVACCLSSQEYRFLLVVELRCLSDWDAEKASLLNLQPTTVILLDHSAKLSVLHSVHWFSLLLCRPLWTLYLKLRVPHNCYEKPNVRFSKLWSVHTVLLLCYEIDWLIEIEFVQFSINWNWTSNIIWQVSLAGMCGKLCQFGFCTCLQRKTFLQAAARYSFSILTLFIWQQEGHLSCKAYCKKSFPLGTWPNLPNGTSSPRNETPKEQCYWGWKCNLVKQKLKVLVMSLLGCQCFVQEQHHMKYAARRSIG